MFEKLFRWVDPILLIGLFISVAIGVGMVLLGEDTVQSFTISLLSTIVTLLIDVIARINKVQSRFLDAARLSRILSKEPAGQTLREIADNFESVEEWDFAHYKTIAHHSLGECNATLRNMASGSVTIVAKHIPEYAKIGIEEAPPNSQVKAIHAEPMEFWNSNYGLTLFQLNRKALARGVRITRIFALTLEQAQEYSAILQRHIQAGVDCHLVEPERIAQEFTIFSNRIVVIPVGEEGEHRCERIVLDPTEVTKKINQFEQLIIKHGLSLENAPLQAEQ